MFPAWSPDGQRIAFSAFDQSGHSAIYVINADGMEQARLTFGEKSVPPAGLEQVPLYRRALDITEAAVDPDVATTPKMPAEMQTKVSEPIARRISVKLPLAQPRWHWTFRSRGDFLAGKLVLRIRRANDTQELVIFEGVLSSLAGSRYRLGGSRTSARSTLASRPPPDI